MNEGKQFRSFFERIVAARGGSVLVHREYGTRGQTTRRVEKAIKADQEEPAATLFRFLAREDVRPGDILKQEGERDLWYVTEVSDALHSGTFISFDANVLQADETGKPRPEWGIGNPLMMSDEEYEALCREGEEAMRRLGPNATLAQKIALKDELLRQDMARLEEKKRKLEERKKR